MPDHNIEEKIKKLSADYIYQEAVGSLLLMLMSAMEDEEKGVMALPCEVPEDVRKIKDEVRSYLLRLEDLLDGEEAERSAALEDCFKLKQRLLTIYEVIYSYFSQWNIVSTMLSDEVALRKYKEENGHIHAKNHQVDWSLFFADCHAFMEDVDTLLQQKTRMSRLLSCLPLRMARDRYYDLVRSSLNKAFTDESKELIEISLKTFESICCPETNPLYGKYFPDIPEALEEKRTIQPMKLENEALAKEYDDMNELMDTLQEIEEYFSCILHDINSLILLFYLTYDFEELTESDVAYADLYHTVSEFLSGELSLVEKAAYLDTINEQLEAAVEPVIDKANEIGKEEHKLLKKFRSFAEFEEDTRKILMTEDFIRDCFFGDLNDELFRFGIPEDLPSASAEEKKALFDEFLKKTRESFDALPVYARRIAMQVLLGALPPVYDVHEMMDFVMEAIDNCVGDEPKFLIVDKVGMIFNEYGYESIAAAKEVPDAEDDCGCTCGHDHHHHDYDCGCDHDHHDHDCGCGHHH